MMRNPAKKLSTIPPRDRLKSTYEALLPAYERALQCQVQDIHSLLEKNGYTPTIKYRIKRFENYYRKLLRNNAPSSEKENGAIGDLLGVRIICPFLEDVERIEALLVENFDVIEADRKGADHSFSEFGYDSVHLLSRIDPGQLETVLSGSRRVCEIQLRTILQDAWAEVEHELVYKSDISLPNDSIRRKLASLNATLTLSDLIFQEIRDYQKDLRLKGRQRRQVMEIKGAEPPPISISSPPFSRPLGSPPLQEPFFMAGGSALEKALLEALHIHSSGNPETAIDLYSQVLRMKMPDSIRSLVYNHRGMARFACSAYSSAVKDFTRCVELDSRNIRGFNNRALTFRMLKNFSRSLEDYNHSAEIDPSQADTYWGRAQTCYEMKFYTRAIEDCEKTIEIHPGHQPALELLQCLRREIF